MRIVSTFVLLLAVILSSIESSRRPRNEWIPSSPENHEVLTAREIESLLNHLDSAEDLHGGDFGHHTSMPPTPPEHTNQDHELVPRPHNFSSQLECLPNYEPTPCLPRSITSCSPDRHHSPCSLERSPPIEPVLRTRSRSHAARSRTSPSRTRYPPATSSTVRHSSLYVLGYSLEQLEFMRFIPTNNQNRQFVIRRYTFPPDIPIYVRGKKNILQSIPTEVQPVLSSSNGEVFALIVERTRTLRGIFIKSKTGVQKRIKINMNSGKIKEMTKVEMRETRCGNNSPISQIFRIVNVQH
ncbi:uncharacterized protein LOC117175657 [Belonocnema kinseyi]|uniref:uncharacterized protein LOC117175657 n=1 Tax=Belonocnema kinseyi TaxID=2817044 RepID=UPI00143D04F4|nr:uncharacterized protein LOC117175657 [Belonocnema kinseyi]